MPNVSFLNSLDITVLVVTSPSHIPNFKSYLLTLISLMMSYYLLLIYLHSTLIKPTTEILSQIVMMMREALPSPHSAISAMKPLRQILLLTFSGLKLFQWLMSSTCESTCSLLLMHGSWHSLFIFQPLLRKWKIISTIKNHFWFLVAGQSRSRTPFSNDNPRSDKSTMC